MFGLPKQERIVNSISENYEFGYLGVRPVPRGGIYLVHLLRDPLLGKSSFRTAVWVPLPPVFCREVVYFQVYKRVIIYLTEVKIFAKVEI